jgi:hypothetical protein
MIKPNSKRLDALMTAGAGGAVAVKEGTRFLYKGHLNGELREGTLREVSQDKHVRLDDSGAWLWPEEIFVEEILTSGQAAGPADELQAIVASLGRIESVLGQLLIQQSSGKGLPGASSFPVPISSGKPAAGPNNTINKHKK